MTDRDRKHILALVRKTAGPARSQAWVVAAEWYWAHGGRCPRGIELAMAAVNAEYHKRYYAFRQWRRPGTERVCLIARPRNIDVVWTTHAPAKQEAF